MQIFSAGAWMVAFLLFFPLLLQFMDEGAHYFKVAGIFILMLLCLFKFIDEVMEWNTGQGITDRLQRRRKVRRSHRGPAR